MPKDRKAAQELIASHLTLSGDAKLVVGLAATGRGRVNKGILSITDSMTMPLELKLTQDITDQVETYLQLLTVPLKFRQQSVLDTEPADMIQRLRRRLHDVGMRRAWQGWPIFPAEINLADFRQNAVC